MLACIAAAAAVSVALVVTTLAAPGACRPTANDGAGPFAQTRIEKPVRAQIETGNVLLGRVLRAGDCKLVAGRLVVLWQAGPNGYSARGRGSVRTDRLGQFRFEGPVPTSYGREPHIHIAVLHPAYEELATSFVVRRGAKSGRIRIVLAPLL